MNKTKCTKIVSLGVVCIVLFGLLSLLTFAAGDNLFPNPEFAVSGKEVTGWSRRGNDSVGYPQVANNIIKPDSADYVVNPNATGNMFHGTVSGWGLETTEPIPLNIDGECLISVWYRSNQENVLRIIIKEYNDDGTAVAGAVDDVKYLPSTSNEWKQYLYAFSEKYNGKKVSVYFRLVDYASETVADGNVYFMSPSFSWDVPAITYLNQNFDNGQADVDSLGEVNASNGTKTLKTDNSNNYVELECPSNATSFYRATIDTSQLIQKRIYKFSFDFMPTAGETPSIYVNQLNDAGTQLKEMKSFKVFPLGTPSNGNWTKYVCYAKLDTEGATKFRIALRVDLGKKVGYDNLALEEAKTEFIFYQNGNEIEKLNAGTLDIKFHNALSEEVTCIMAMYKIEGNVKTLENIFIDTAEAIVADTSTDYRSITTAFESEPKATFSIDSAAANYEVTGFIWNGIGSLSQFNVLPETHSTVATE